MGKRRGEAYRRDLVKRFDERRPGVTLVDFCLENQVTTGQVYAYKRRFKSQRSSAGLPAMVPVQIIESHSTVPLGLTDGSVEVAVGTGVVLRFQVGADARYMAELIAGVGRRLEC